MRVVPIGGVQVSGLCIGGNPFSGFAHQTKERSREMLDYFTPEKIKETLHEAEEVGINTFFVYGGSGEREAHIGCSVVIRDRKRVNMRRRCVGMRDGPHRDDDSFINLVRSVVDDAKTETSSRLACGDRE